jgi:hypothetical protein
MSHGPLAGKSEDEVLAAKRRFIAASIVRGVRSAAARPIPRPRYRLNVLFLNS